MTNEEKKLISNYRLSIISKDNFLKSYPSELNTDYIQSVLKSVFINKSATELDYALTLLFFDPTFDTSERYIEILSKLLLAEWHYKHEDIALILQKIKSPKTIDVLYERTLIKPIYMDYDESYSLARKCIHALGDINTDYAREKLKILAASNIPVIKEKARKQLCYCNL